MTDIMFNRLLEEWGISKLTQVLILAIIGAGIFGTVGIAVIPNKEKETE